MKDETFFPSYRFTFQAMFFVFVFLCIGFVYFQRNGYGAKDVTFFLVFCIMTALVFLSGFFSWQLKRRLYLNHRSWYSEIYEVSHSWPLTRFNGWFDIIWLKRNLPKDLYFPILGQRATLIALLVHCFLFFFGVYL